MIAKTMMISAMAATLALGSAASAVTVVVNQTLDLTQPKTLPGPGFQGWQGSPAFNGGYNVALAEGDTFDFTIDFLGSQSLTMVGPQSVWAFSYSDTLTNVAGTGTLSLLDSSGNAFLTSVIKTDVEGVVHFGQQFNGFDFVGGLPSTLTFYGVHYVGTVDDYLDPLVTTRDYASPAFYVDARIVTTGTVPEPASWALMIGGFGLVGAALRRRRAAFA